MLVMLAVFNSSARGSTAYGSLHNFDVVNDTGTECHGFEIEIEDIHSSDITYTYNWNHYGTPQIIEDNSNPLRPRVIVRYASKRDTNGNWASYTAIPSGPIAPTDGHRFTDPSVNFGGEHFGVGYYGAATNISYYWLIDNGQGTLARGPSVQVATPAFNYIAPVGGAPAQVQAAIRPPPAPPILEFGPASWVKEIKTTTHNNNKVDIRDLVSDDPDDDEDRNWRNGEPDEVEIEWQLFQTEFSKPDGGANGEIEGIPEPLDDGDEVVTRRYEFYKYVGPLDEESGEAKASKVGPDGIHGEGLKIINGEEVDLSTVIVVGDYIGAQMSAFDAEASVGLIEQVQDGVTGEPYPTRTLVIPGNYPFSATNWGKLPEGMTFDVVSGQLSGTPTETGVFQFTIKATAAPDPVVQRTYTLTITEPGVELPARSTVDTVPSPLESGTTTGDGTYTNGTLSTVTAVPREGYIFKNWTEHGREVSRSPDYTFTNIINRALIANFVPAPPRLSFELQIPGSLLLTWPTNQLGFVLETINDLAQTNWVAVTNQQVAVGTNFSVLLTPQGGSSYFRLVKPQ